MILENIQKEQDLQDNDMVQKILEAFQACIKRIQWKKQKFQELKDQMRKKNLKIKLFENDHDKEHQRSKRNYQIQKRKIKKYECKICKNTYDQYKYKQLGRHKRKGYPWVQYSALSFYEQKL